MSAPTTDQVHEALDRLLRDDKAIEHLRRHGSVKVPIFHPLRMTWQDDPDLWTKDEVSFVEFRERIVEHRDGSRYYEIMADGKSVRTWPIQ